MNDSTIKSFLHKTYQSKSPIAYIIAIQVGVFLMISIVGIFSTQSTSYRIFEKLSLATSFSKLIDQPWSIITFPFAYNRLLPLLFDCLWLYWVGNMFLNLLSYRNFFFVFGGGLIIGAITNLTAGTFFPMIANIQYHSITYGISALLTAQATLNPKSEVNLLLLGNVKFRTIAIVFILLSLLTLFFSKDYTGFIGFMASIFLGNLYTRSLQSGNDWSNILKNKQRKNLKVIYGHNNKTTAKAKDTDSPSQEVIDSILDKISVSGYDSLSKKEKETLFKLSKENQE